MTMNDEKMDGNEFSDEDGGLTWSAPAQSHGGDVRSNSETIAAIRRGVEIDRQVAAINGVPVALTHGASGTSITVLKDVIREIARREPGPRRRAGTVELHTETSLIEYVNRFRVSAHSLGFLEQDLMTLTVVLDHHRSFGDITDTGWCEDRARLQLRCSRQWLLWSRAAEKEWTQTQFADLLDANEADLAAPQDDNEASATRMCEMARNLQIHTKGTFERVINPTTGEGSLVVKDEQDTRSTKIPRGFRLALPVFDGAADKYPVAARLRMRMESGRPLFSFCLMNEAECMEHAIETLRERVALATAVTVLRGAPPISTPPTGEVVPF